MFRRTSLRPVTVVLALLAVFIPAEASRVRQLNIQQMTERASRVFAGRCTDVHVERDPRLGLDVTVARFEVDRAAKGKFGRHLVIRLLGGGTGASISGRPDFAPGEEVILFLYPDSRHGLTSPVGFGQGKFTVLTDKQGRRVALNQFGNRRLFEGVDPGVARRLPRHGAGAQGPIPISPEALLDVAEALGGER